MRARSLRLIDSGPMEPALNMAIDEVLLAGAEERPTLRLYAWEPEAISLGFFQAFRSHGGLATVRRITGGGAIHHRRSDLTFAVAAPFGVLGAPGGRVRESFEAVNRAVARALERVGVLVGAGIGPGESAAESGEEEPFLCFERRSPTDLRVGARKLVGSAQRRSGRAVLHHGSIALGGGPPDDGRGSDRAGRERFTVSAAAARPVSYDELARALVEAVREGLEVRVEPGTLGPDEDRTARRLASEKYGAETWTARR